MVQRECSGRRSPKTDEIRGPGKIAMGGHFESYKDTEVAMVQLHKKDGRRKSSEEGDRVKIRFQKSKTKTKKSMGETGIRGHEKDKNPQLEGEDPGSEVMEENRKGGKDEQDI